MFVVRKFVFFVLVAALLVSCQSSQSNRQHTDRNEFYQDVKTAKVIVQESYGVHKGIALPFKSYIELWLNIAGVAVTNDAAGSADCVIRIAAEGEPLKATYGLFTGARLKGTIQIERPSLHKDEVRFSGVVNPPLTFRGSNNVDYEKPENAPFLSALSSEDDPHRTGINKTAFDAFKLRLAVLMGQYFGRSVLLIALDDYKSNGVLRESAIEALVALGKPSVSYLIEAFLFCSPEAEKGVGEALEKITGEKYGSDAKLWNEWLLRQEKKQ
jgi:hypothetical protein